MEALNEILAYELIHIGEHTLHVYSLAVVLLIILFTRAILWMIKKTLFRHKKFKKLDAGSAYALFQIIKYFIWILAFGFMLESLGIKVTVLVAGSAALLVGVGLGLQQTFNDIVSGIILLSERSIKIDDVLEIDGDIVKIRHIGVRTSVGLNTDDISIIIPNSLITTNKVINWSHQSKRNRFSIEVGVAYGSNVDLVLSILEESANTHPDTDDHTLTEARLVNFGNSSLDFEVLFFSKNIFRISKVKSDIRRTINQKFAVHNITIPFPQIDLHFRSSHVDLGPKES